MHAADRIDYLEFPSTSSETSRAFFAKAFGWSFRSFSPSYDEIVGPWILTGLESGDAVKTAAPFVAIRTNDLEAARHKVVAAGGEITLDQFEFPGGARFHFRDPGGPNSRCGGRTTEGLRDFRRTIS